MKLWRKRLISGLLCCALAAALCPAALAESLEGAEEFPEDSVVETSFDTILGAGEETEGEPSAIYADNAPIGGIGEEENFPEGSMTEVLLGEDVLGSGEEEITPENSTTLPAGSDDNLGLVDDETKIVPDEDKNYVPETEEADGGQLGASGATVSFAKSRVDLTQGESAAVTVTVSYANATGCYLQFGISNTSAIRCAWGSWSGYSIPLTITGKGNGSGYVYVYLKNGSGTTLASTKIQVVVVNNSATLRASLSSVTVKKGNTTSVTLTYAGYSGCVYLSYGTTNTTAYTCSWGGWYGSSIPLKIQGNSIGKGTVTVYLKTISGKTLASTSISVSVITSENPKLSNIPSTQLVGVNEKVVIHPSYSGYSGTVTMQYSIGNTDVCSCYWGDWSGQSNPLTITGKSSGTTTVRIYLKSIAGVTLASESLTVSVYRKENPDVSASQTSLSVNTGNSGTIAFTVTGVSGAYYLVYSSSNTNAYTCTWGSWSGNKIHMTVTGKNAGTGSIKVYLKDLAGNILDSTTISPVKVTSVSNPTVTVSQSSVSLTPGASSRVTVTYANSNEKIYLQYGTTNTSAYSCTWGNWTGNSIPLTITGKSDGTGTITVYLKRSSDNSVLASTPIYVTVIGQNTPDGMGYGFENYSKNYISLDICKYMYGDNQTARSVYAYNIGNGGVCFGMSASSSLLSVTSDAPTLRTFSGTRASIADLVKSDYSSSLKLSVSDFVEAMHIMQVSSSMKFSRGLDSLAQTVRTQTSQNLPVLIGIRGTEGGHMITAYGYKETDTQMAIQIYDSNYPKQERTLYLERTSAGGSYTSWHYQIFRNTTWGTGYPKNDITFIPYADYYKVWEMRKGPTLNQSYNLLCTTEDDFTVYGMDEDGKMNVLVVQYKDGVLVQQSDEVIETPVVNALPDGTFADVAHILYVPVDYYEVHDDSPEDGIEMTLSNLDLAAKVETEADKFEICADDGDGAGDLGIATVLLTPEEGETYTISLCSIREGDPDQISINGSGNGTLIGAEFKNGALGFVGDGASVSLSVIDYDETYAITVLESEGGRIWTETEDAPKQGDNRLYQVEANDGYRIGAVYVDGVDCGAVSSYLFTEIDAPHTISATFVKDMAACTVSLSEELYLYNGSQKCPEVTVTDEAGNELRAGADYTVSYMDNIAPGTAVCIVSAAAGGSYGGSVYKEFTIAEGSAEGNVLALRYEGESIRAVVICQTDGILFGAVYDADGKLLDIVRQDVDAAPEETVYPLNLTLTGGAVGKAFLLDRSTLVPLCPGVELTLSGTK